MCPQSDRIRRVIKVINRIVSEAARAACWSMHPRWEESEKEPAYAKERERARMSEGIRGGIRGGRGAGRCFDEEAGIETGITC